MSEFNMLLEAQRIGRAAARRQGRSDSRDLVQEAFLGMLSAKPTDKTHQLDRYLRRTAFLTCLTGRRQFMYEDLFVSLGEHVSDSPDPEHLAIASAIRERVTALLGADRGADILDVIAGNVAPKELAEEWGVSVQTVYSVVKRARMELRADKKLKDLVNE
jgi:DNA-directed RNA polymerase specialized sigma24 family protein